VPLKKLMRKMPKIKKNINIIATILITLGIALIKEEITIYNPSSFPTSLNTLTILNIFINYSESRKGVAPSIEKMTIIKSKMFQGFLI